MSLKTVHIFFVVCTTLLTIVMAVWNYTNWVNFGQTSSLVYMVISSVCGFAAIVYGKKFLVKFKDLSFM
ncbi:MAG: hypothetical protein H8E72_00840 [Candidatus Marinimicrobia bacterium]|nr:hypothetical protein [Candidatus Neomarinimicrobiota bacterium]